MNGLRSGLSSWVAGMLMAGLAALIVGCGDDVEGPNGPNGPEEPLPPLDPQLVDEGREIFRFDTFGDEQFWTDVLKMNTVVETLTPAQALSLGLKVDVEALPQAVKDGLTDGDPNTVPLDDPATTLALLSLDAVVGVQGTVENGELVRFGITCAICHSTVDNSFAPGIGRRLDGWPNRDLNPGAIIAASPAVEGATEQCYSSWGPGMYDARFNIDGLCKPTVIPPAYGLRGIDRIIFTGDGDEVRYWNRYVAVTQMHGQGTFEDDRLGISISHIPPGGENLVAPKLAALQEYQLSLPAPEPPAGSFDPAAAARGKIVFEGQGTCSTCHVPTNHFTLDDLLPVSASMAEPETPSYAARSATGLYRSSPLEGVWQHPPYFHDGSAATLMDVVNIYNSRLSLSLSDQQTADLVEYLESL